MGLRTEACTSAGSTGGGSVSEQCLIWSWICGVSRTGVSVGVTCSMLHAPCITSHEYVYVRTLCVCKHEQDLRVSGRGIHLATRARNQLCTNYIPANEEISKVRSG